MPASRRAALPSGPHGRGGPVQVRWGWPGLLSVLVAVGISVALRPATTPARWWTLPLGSVPVALALAAHTGRLLVAEPVAQTLSLRDARTGALRATVPLGHAPEALAVDEVHDRVYTLDGCGEVPVPNPVCRTGAHALSIIALWSGTLLGTVALGSGATALAVDAGTDRVFVAFYAADEVGVVDGRSGRVRRTVTLDGAPQALVVDARSQRVFVSTLTLVGGRSSVSVLDGRTGTLLATRPVGRSVGALLADTRTQRVLAASDGDVYLLDARSGRVLHDLRGDGAPLAVDEQQGRALVTGQGQVRMISTRNGAPTGPLIQRGAIDALALHAVAVDARIGRFYLATDQGVVVLDERTGRVRRVLALPQAPLDLAVDAMTRRVFVLTGSPVVGGDRPSHELPWVQWLRRTLPWLPRPVPPPPPGHDMLTVLETAGL